MTTAGFHDGAENLERHMRSGVDRCMQAAAVPRSAQPSPPQPSSSVEASYPNLSGQLGARNQIATPGCVGSVLGQIDHPSGETSHRILQHHSEE